VLSHLPWTGGGRCPPATRPAVPRPAPGVRHAAGAFPRATPSWPRAWPGFAGCHARCRPSRPRRAETRAGQRPAEGSGRGPGERCSPGATRPVPRRSAKSPGLTYW